MCQVRFRPAFAEDENRSDLPVRPSVGDELGELGDTLLRRRQPFLPGAVAALSELLSSLER
jgi:hypothetical protein